MESLNVVLYAIEQFFTYVFNVIVDNIPFFSIAVLSLFALTVLVGKVLKPMLGSVGSDSAMSEEEYLRRKAIDNWNNSVKTRHRRIDY